MQEFEKYPLMQQFIQEYASFNRFSNWSYFLAELNRLLYLIPSPSEKKNEGKVHEFHDIRGRKVKEGDLIRVYQKHYLVEKDEEGKLWAIDLNKQHNLLLDNWDRSFEIIKPSDAEVKAEPQNELFWCAKADAPLSGRCESQCENCKDWGIKITQPQNIELSDNFALLFCQNPEKDFEYYSKLKTEFTKAVQPMIEELKSLRGMNRFLSKKKIELMNCNEEQEQQISDLKNQVNQTTTDLVKLDLDYSVSQQQISSLKKQVEERGKEIERITGSVYDHLKKQHNL